MLGQLAEAWLLEFNVVKCYIFHFGKLNPCCSYFFLGHPLSINNEQDLGVTADNELKFSAHAKISVAGASSTMGLNKHILSTYSAKAISLLHEGLVHPKLEVGKALA